MEADISTQAVGLASNTDFSIINLFIRADIIVKTVIIILGDKKYKKKFKKFNNIDPKLERLLININRQFLHAKTLGFVHPITRKEMEFSSFLPQELEKILKMLKKLKK